LSRSVIFSASIVCTTSVKSLKCVGVGRFADVAAPQVRVCVYVRYLALLVPKPWNALSKPQDIARFREAILNALLHTGSSARTGARV
jgi:hypothetical protein